MLTGEVLEAADSFGADYWQRLFGVQIPLALPNIMAGINQTIMMALAMVVIASMIGVKGLGQPVLKAVTNQYFALGLFNGLCNRRVGHCFRSDDTGLWPASAKPPADLK